LAACDQKTELIPTQATPVPFHTATSTQTPAVLAGPTQIIIPPTPTIVTYTVVQGDTLSSIAQHAGVSLEALLAANPGVSPAALSVGTKLVIPAGNSAPVEPTPTPALLPVRQARCWPEATGGLWCLALVQNDYPETLENLSARFALLDTNGQEITSQIVYGLLDILPSGKSMPLAAHFAAPVQAGAGVRVQVVTAIRLLQGDTRYLPVNLENTLASVEASGRTAKISGRILLTGNGTANTLWVLASAYDQSGNVVGVRRWESTAALTVNSPVAFDFQIASLGPEIARVEFLAEARP
jgi:murein DD-endopeptidase MepM/ murein hydrolase activator NlpD